MGNLIKVIEISNAHQWDGLELTKKEFNNLLDALWLSRFRHVVLYEENGETYKMIIE